MPLCGSPQVSPLKNDAFLLPITQARYRKRPNELTAAGAPSPPPHTTGDPAAASTLRGTPRASTPTSASPLRKLVSGKTTPRTRVGSRSPTHLRRALSKSPSPSPSYSPLPRTLSTSLPLPRAASACPTRMKSYRSSPRGVHNAQPTCPPPLKRAMSSFRSVSPGKGGGGGVSVPALVLRAHSYSHSGPKTPRSVPQTARVHSKVERVQGRSHSAGTPRCARDTVVSGLKSMQKYRRGGGVSPRLDLAAANASNNNTSPPGTPPPTSPKPNPFFGEFVKETSTSPTHRSSAAPTGLPAFSPTPAAHGVPGLEKGKVIKICARNIDDLTFSAKQLFQMNSSVTARKGFCLNKGFNDKMSGGLVVAVVAVPKNVRTMNALCTIASRVLGWTGTTCSSRVCSLHLPNGNQVHKVEELQEGGLYVVNNLQHISSNPYESCERGGSASRSKSPNPTSTPRPETLHTTAQTTPGCVTFSVLPYGGERLSMLHPVAILKARLHASEMDQVVDVIKEELSITGRQSGCAKPEEVKLMTLNGKVIQHPTEIDHGGVYLVTSGGISGVRNDDVKGVAATKVTGWALRTSIVSVSLNGMPDSAVTVTIPQGASRATVLNIVTGALSLEKGGDTQEVGILNASGDNLLKGTHFDVVSGASLVATTSPGEFLICAPSPTPGRKFSLIM